MFVHNNKFSTVEKKIVESTITATDVPCASFTGIFPAE